jgi:hypothetical protein
MAKVDNLDTFFNQKSGPVVYIIIPGLSTLAINLNLDNNIKQKNCYDMFYNIGNKLVAILRESI